MLIFNDLNIFSNEIFFIVIFIKIQSFSKLLNSILISSNDSVFFISLNFSSIVHQNLLLKLEDWSKKFCWMHEDFFIKCEETELSSKNEYKETVLKSLFSLDVKTWDVASKMCQSIADWVRKKWYIFWQLYIKKIIYWILFKYKVCQLIDIVKYFAAHSAMQSSDFYYFKQYIKYYSYWRK